MLPKKRRLTTALFDQVFKNGRVQHSERFWIRSFLLAEEKKLNTAKFAVAVSKKTAPTAVARNSIKRKIYKVIEKVVSTDSSRIGVIVGVKTNLNTLTPSQFEPELTLLLKKVLK